MEGDPFEEFLQDNVKHAQAQLYAYKDKKRVFLNQEAAEEPVPHLEQDEEDDGQETKKKPKTKKRKKIEPDEKKNKKMDARTKTMEGPCSGRLWSSTNTACPGAAAGRGKNPEKEANTFVGGVWDKKRRPFCVSCKKELIKLRAAQKKKKKQEEDQQ